MQDCGFFKSGVKVFIVGKGLTGQSFVHFCEKHQINYCVIKLDLNKSIEHQVHPMRGGIALVSPGLLPQWKEIFEKNNILYASDLDIFFAEVKFKKALVVTGTNGKTSSCDLLKHLLDKLVPQNTTVFKGGNIGVPALSLLDTITDKDYLIIEASSYQLYWSKLFGNRKKDIIGAITSFSQDHLYWHQGLNNYKAAKFSLLNLCSKVIASPSCADLFKGTCIAKVRGKIVSPKVVIDKNKEVVVSLLLELGYDVNDDFIDLVEDFVPSEARGTRYRIGETVFINDAKATNIEAVIALCESLQIKNKTLWILGGDFKGQSLEVLRSFDLYQNIDIAFFNADTNFLDKLPITPKFVDISFRSLLKSIRCEKSVLDYRLVVLSPGGSSIPEFEGYKALGKYFVSFFKNSTERTS